MPDAPIVWKDPPVVRRSFRFGWRLGLLAGVAFAIAKLVQSKRGEPSPSFSAQPAPWPPMPEPAPEPAHIAPEHAVPDPDAPHVASPPGDHVVPDPDAPADPAPKAARKATRKVATVAWVQPEGDVCPPTHPVKAKLASKIFHLPGMFAYDRTRPDRCYRDESAAEGDGLRKAKR